MTPHLSLFNHPTTPQIYPLSLHDALPISRVPTCSPSTARTIASFSLTSNTIVGMLRSSANAADRVRREREGRDGDRKSTRLNSSHRTISYAVFCLKKKNNPDILG